jgi:hypothetical protein
MRAIAIFLAALLVSLFATAQPSGAIAYHPWCAKYQYISYSTVCAFDTQAQCLADVRGVGGFCIENAVPPPYPLAAPHGASRRGAKRHNAVQN